MKVMVSLPEATVRTLDALAKRAGTSRSAVVRRLAEDAAGREHKRQRAEAIRLYGPPESRTADSLASVKAAREAR